MNYRAKILSIRAGYLKGKIDLDTVKSHVLPLLDEMNTRGAVIAKRHGQKFKKLKFPYIFR